MQMRGAPLIGAVAAYGMCLALRADASTEAMERDAALLAATRPTAVNLRWAIDRMLTRLRNTPAAGARRAPPMPRPALIADEDVAQNEAIGRHGAAADRGGGGAGAGPRGERADPLQCRLAGDGGLGHRAGADLHGARRRASTVHVWVDETRPRNQGAALTAWELGTHGVPHTVMADNAGGHLMQHGKVDLAIVGADRVTRSGDVANKIGTYLKALAAHDNGVPFWVALPSTTIDWTVADGVAEIPIEERAAAEVTDVTGRAGGRRIATVRVAPPAARRPTRPSM